MTDQNTATREQLETMVAEADTGGRKPTGFAKQFLMAVALGWALFQLWYASPLPYMFNIGVFNDSQARVIHLSFAFVLAFSTFPALKSSPRHRVPAYDIALAILGVASACYLIVFYKEIALRPGLPTTVDIVVSVIGVVLLTASLATIGLANAMTRASRAGVVMREEFDA